MSINFHSKVFPKTVPCHTVAKVVNSKGLKYLIPNFQPVGLLRNYTFQSCYPCMEAKWVPIKVAIIHFDSQSYHNTLQSPINCIARNLNRDFHKGSMYLRKNTMINLKVLIYKAVFLSNSPFLYFLQPPSFIAKTHHT